MTTSKSMIRKPARGFAGRVEFWAAILLIAAVGTLIYTAPPTEGPHPYQCPRTAAGGYELMAFKVRQSGEEYDCRFVKRGLPAVKPGVR